MTQKDSFRVELFRFYGKFDTISSNLFVTLPNLRAVQSAPPSVKKIYYMKEGGGDQDVNNFEKKDCIIGKVGHP